MWGGAGLASAGMSVLAPLPDGGVVGPSVLSVAAILTALEFCFFFGLEGSSSCFEDLLLRLVGLLTCDVFFDLDLAFALGLAAALLVVFLLFAFAADVFGARFFRLGLVGFSSSLSSPTSSAMASEVRVFLPRGFPCLEKSGREASATILATSFAKDGCSGTWYLYSPWSSCVGPVALVTSFKTGGSGNGGISEMPASTNTGVGTLGLTSQSSSPDSSRGGAPTEPDPEVVDGTKGTCKPCTEWSSRHTISGSLPDSQSSTSTSTNEPQDP